MKNRADRILLAVLLATAALYALVLLGVLLDLLPSGGLPVTVLVCLHAVPVFCLQLLLCRRVKWLLMRLLPLLLELLAVFVCALGMAGAEGWDGLGWALLLLLTFAPGVGIALGWAAYGVQRLRAHVNG